MAKRAIFYLNQFFGGIGGEDMADHAPEFRTELVGPAQGIASAAGDDIEAVGTIICGDNFFGQREDEAVEFIKNVLTQQKPDIFIAGPAFNAGRYGFACAGACKAADELGITCVSGMYAENPGLEHCQSFAWVAETANAAAQMRKAIPAMANLVKKLSLGEEVTPEDDHYFPQGRRECILVDEIGSKRAVNMLLARLNDEPFTTELPMPSFDVVEPAPAILDLSKATIALATSGGIVPLGNPDHLQSASAQQWNKYDISSEDDLKSDFFTVHGGFDPVYCNEDADRVAPLDALRELEREGKIGKVYDYMYTTTGTGTAVANARAFGKEIGAELKDAGVDGVILTST
ncbi:Glycine reductase complex component B subunit gamma [Slackia heliotrinireducens]|nr:Glycine reductase complex component B subunit gamma [Slackia heliotrinireducens]